MNYLLNVRYLIFYNIKTIKIFYCVYFVFLKTFARLSSFFCISSLIVLLVSFSLSLDVSL